MLNRGPFCGATDNPCLGFRITLPMSFKAGMDSLWHELLRHLCPVIPRTISGRQVRASNPDRSTLRQPIVPTSLARLILLYICLVDMIAVPDFQAGAMENWGLIIYRETALLYDPQEFSTGNKQRVCLVVSHELAHQVSLFIPF